MPFENLDDVSAVAANIESEDYLQGLFYSLKGTDARSPEAGPLSDFEERSSLLMARLSGLASQASKASAAAAQRPLSAYVLVSGGSQDELADAAALEMTALALHRTASELSQDRIPLTNAAAENTLRELDFTLQNCQYVLPATSPPPLPGALCAPGSLLPLLLLLLRYLSIACCARTPRTPRAARYAWQGWLNVQLYAGQELGADLPGTAGPCRCVCQLQLHRQTGWACCCADLARQHDWLAFG